MHLASLCCFTSALSATWVVLSFSISVSLPRAVVAVVVSKRRQKAIGANRVVARCWDSGLASHLIDIEGVPCCIDCAHCSLVGVHPCTCRDPIFTLRSIFPDRSNITADIGQPGTPVTNVLPREQKSRENPRIFLMRASEFHASVKTCLAFFSSSSTVQDQAEFWIYFPVHVKVLVIPNLVISNLALESFI